MDLQTKRKLVEYLYGYITPERRRKIAEVAANRTRYLTVALEDIYQPQNASAVVRTCDCFGVQDVHIIENRNKYTINPDVTLGAQKWVSLIRYNKPDHNNTEDCIEALRRAGYRIVATTPREGACLLHEFPIEGKMALLFGTEETGLSDYALEHADEFLKIPMYGFTQSFNISVSAALCIHHIITKLRASQIDWRLSEEELLDLKLEWLRKQLRRAPLLEEEFFKGQTTGE